MTARKQKEVIHWNSNCLEMWGHEGQTWDQIIRGKVEILGVLELPALRRFPALLWAWFWALFCFWREREEPEERFYSQIPASFLLCVPLLHCSVSPHAVNFSEIHFLAVAIGSASVLMIIVVTAVIICRQRRRRARDKRLEVADTEW